MSAKKTFQQIGAFLCALIGIFSIVVTAELAPRATSRSDKLFLIPLIIYTLLAFVPFIAFVYPRLKTPRKSVWVSMSLLELLVLGLFLYAILFFPLMPNKSLQATRDGRSSSASRFTSFGPACLSSGR